MYDGSIRTASNMHSLHYHTLVLVFLGLVVISASPTSSATGRICRPRVPEKTSVLRLRGGSGPSFFSTDVNDARIWKAQRKNEKASKGRQIQHVGSRAKKKAEARALAVKAKKEQQETESRESRKRQRELLARRQLGVADVREAQQIFWTACDKGETELLTRCMMAGVDVNFNYSVVTMRVAEGVQAVEGINATVLHIAARNNHTAVIDRLVRMRANVNARTAFGTTPLMTACHRGSCAAAVLLVQSGADMWAEDLDGQCAAEIAELYAEDWRIGLWIREAMTWHAGGSNGPMPLPYREGEYPVPDSSVAALQLQPRAWAARATGEGGDGAEAEASEERGGGAEVRETWRRSWPWRGRGG